MLSVCINIDVIKTSQFYHSNKAAANILIYLLSALFPMPIFGVEIKYYLN